MAAKSRQLQIRVTPAQKERLKRLAEAAGQDVSGYVLDRVLPSGQARFEELLALLAQAGDHRYALAELNDLLAESGAAELREAVAHADVGPLPPFLANYVAAMVEQACHKKGVAPPAWTAGIPPLESPWFAAPSAGLRLHLLRSSPVSFKRRNLFVDAGVGDRV